MKLTEIERAGAMSQRHTNREPSGPDSSTNLYTYIVERAAISPTILERVRRIADENGEDIARVLLRTGAVAESVLANLLADYSECALVDRRDFPESLLLEQRNGRHREPVTDRCTTFALGDRDAKRVQTERANPDSNLDSGAQWLE